jgi:hypothetical protein
MIGNIDSDFGWATAISDDGTVVAASGPYDQGAYGVQWVGAVSVYHKSTGESNWTLRDRVSVGNKNDAFGFSLALSGEGRRMAVGSFLKPPGRSTMRLFEYDGTFERWGMTFADKGYNFELYDDGNYSLTRSHFGQSVALSEDGTLLATGSGYPPSASFFPSPTPS